MARGSSGDRVWLCARLPGGVPEGAARGPGLRLVPDGARHGRANSSRRCLGGELARRRGHLHLPLRGRGPVRRLERGRIPNRVRAADRVLPGHARAQPPHPDTALRNSRGARCIRPDARPGCRRRGRSHDRRHRRCAASGRERSAVRGIGRLRLRHPALPGPGALAADGPVSRTERLHERGASLRRRHQRVHLRGPGAPHGARGVYLVLAHCLGDACGRRRDPWGRGAAEIGGQLALCALLMVVFLAFAQSLLRLVERRVRISGDLAL